MGRRQRSCRMRASRASARPQASPRARSRDGRSCHSAYVRLKGSGEGQKSAGEPAGEVPRVSKTQTAAAQRGRVASQRHTAPCTHRPPHGPAASIACGRSSASLPARRRIAGRLTRDRHRDTYTQDAAHLPENEPRKRSTPPCSRCACAAANARRSSTATATSIAARGHPPPRGARIALDAKHTRHNKRRLRCDQLSRPLVQHSRSATDPRSGAARGRPATRPPLCLLWRRAERLRCPSHDAPHLRIYTSGHQKQVCFFEAVYSFVDVALRCGAAAEARPPCGSFCSG